MSLGLALLGQTDAGTDAGQGLKVSLKCTCKKLILKNPQNLTKLAEQCSEQCCLIV